MLKTNIFYSVSPQVSSACLLLWGAENDLEESFIAFFLSGQMTAELPRDQISRWERFKDIERIQICIFLQLEEW